MEGSKYVHVVAPLDTIPLFVKGGGIIPMQPEMIYTGEKPVDVITLDVFPHGASSYQLYEDDGTTLEYQKEIYSVTNIRSNLQSGKLKLSIEKTLGDHKPGLRTYTAKIHWNGKKPAAVTENGKKVDQSKSMLAGKNSGWYYDEAAKLIWISTKGNNSVAIDLVVN